MDTPATDFVCAGSLEELKAKGRLVVHGPHRPILVVHDKDRVFALLWHSSPIRGAATARPQLRADCPWWTGRLHSRP